MESLLNMNNNIDRGWGTWQAGERARADIAKKKGTRKDRKGDNQFIMDRDARVASRFRKARKQRGKPKKKNFCGLSSYPKECGLDKNRKKNLTAQILRKKKRNAKATW